MTLGDAIVYIFDRVCVVMGVIAICEVVRYAIGRVRSRT